MKFRLLAGKHEELGKVYSAQGMKVGDPRLPVIESDRPLDEVFRGKFEKVVEVAKAPAPETPEVEKAPEAEAPAADVVAPETPEVEKAPEAVGSYTLVKAKGNRYNVVLMDGMTEKGEPLNKRPLQEEQARGLMNQANEELKKKASGSEAEVSA